MPSAVAICLKETSAGLLSISIVFRHVRFAKAFGQPLRHMAERQVQVGGDLAQSIVLHLAIGQIAVILTNPTKAPKVRRIGSSVTLAQKSKPSRRMRYPSPA